MNLVGDLKELKETIIRDAMAKYRSMIQIGEHDYNQALTMAVSVAVLTDCAIANAGSALIGVLGVNNDDFVKWCEKRRETFYENALERLKGLRYAAAANDMLIDAETRTQIHKGEADLDPAVRAFAQGEFLKIEYILAREIARRFLEHNP